MSKNLLCLTLFAVVVMAAPVDPVDRRDVRAPAQREQEVVGFRAYVTGLNGRRSAHRRIWSWSPIHP